MSAFVQIIELAAADPAVIAADPVTRPWTDHLRARPPSADDRVLLMRRWLGRESGELRSPAVSACWLDVKRVYMELRPRLRRLYSTVVDLPSLGPIFLPLGFAPVGDPVDVDGVAHQCVCLDFGPRSVDGWLGRLVEAETEQEAAPAEGLSPASPRCCGSSPPGCPTVRSARRCTSASARRAGTSRTCCSSSVCGRAPRRRGSPPSAAS